MFFWLLIFSLMIEFQIFPPFTITWMILRSCCIAKLIAQPMLKPNFSQTWHGYALLCTYPTLSTLLLSPVSILLLLPHFTQPKTNLTATPLYYYCFSHDFIKFYLFPTLTSTPTKPNPWVVHRTLPQRNEFSCIVQ